ncbi:MAG TPA: Gfo/Idh/MocA family oxidoreductase [Acidobacteriaceae bacterium]|jgi:predicted dehydrogenase
MASVSNSANIRVAVLGFGLAGRVFHCPFVSAVPGLELAAIVQRKGDEAAAAYPSARILRSVEDALADSSIDLIVVGTPNDTHFDLAVRALQAGKHVVIDKPFAATGDEALSLVALAKDTSRVLAPFHNRRFDGDFLTVQQLLLEKTLGRIVQVVSRFDRYRPYQRPNTWKEASGPSNGMVFDLGPHLVDQALALFGVPDTVTANIRRDRDQTDIDDGFHITLEYKAQRLLYECHATLLAAEPSPRFLIHGTHGSYSKGGVDPQEPAIVAGARPPHQDSPTPWLPEPESAWGTLTRATHLLDPITVERGLYPTLTGDYRRYYENVRDAILGSAPLAVTAEDGYRSIRLLEQAQQSAREGRSVNVAF